MGGADALCRAEGCRPGVLRSAPLLLLLLPLSAAVASAAVACEGDVELRPHSASEAS